MNISVDISLYPLQDEFIPAIIDFIHRIQLHEGVEVARNAMSTQLFGDYEAVMTALQAELRYSFENHGRSVLVAKILPVDARTSYQE